MSLKIGDKFKVVTMTHPNYGFITGSIIELVYNDGSQCPYFKLIVGDHMDGKSEGHTHLSDLEPYPDFPDFPFKLRNGDKPEVRQWLKDNGCCWAISGDITAHNLNETNLYVTEKIVYKSLRGFDYESNNEQEIQLEIKPAVVTGYSLVEKVNKKSEKELQLEEIIAKLSSQLNEAQTELNKLK